MLINFHFLFSPQNDLGEDAYRSATPPRQCRGGCVERCDSRRVGFDLGNKELPAIVSSLNEILPPIQKEGDRHSEGLHHVEALLNRLKKIGDSILSRIYLVLGVNPQDLEVNTRDPRCRLPTDTISEDISESNSSDESRGPLDVSLPLSWNNPARETEVQSSFVRLRDLPMKIAQLSDQEKTDINHAIYALRLPLLYLSGRIVLVAKKYDETLKQIDFLLAEFYDLLEDILCVGCDEIANVNNAELLERIKHHETSCGSLKAQEYIKLLRVVIALRSIRALVYDKFQRTYQQTIQLFDNLECDQALFSMLDRLIRLHMMESRTSADSTGTKLGLVVKRWSALGSEYAFIHEEKLLVRFKEFLGNWRSFRNVSNLQEHATPECMRYLVRPTPILDESISPNCRRRLVWQDEDSAGVLPNELWLDQASPVSSATVEDDEVVLLPSLKFDKPKRRNCWSTLCSLFS